MATLPEQKQQKRAVCDSMEFPEAIGVRVDPSSIPDTHGRLPLNRHYQQYFLPKFGSLLYYYHSLYIDLKIEMLYYPHVMAEAVTKVGNLNT